MVRDGMVSFGMNKIGPLLAVLHIGLTFCSSYQ